MGRRLRPQAKTAAPDRWQRGTALGSLFSVLLVAVGLYLTNDFNREQQNLAIKGQRADRFVKAIDQLGQEGNDKLGIRLGGIYALETLMRDSPDDENTIIEVLCAFIRTHAPRPKANPKQIPASPVDVRATLNVLGRLPDPNHHTHPDLSNSLLGLDRMDLHGAAMPAVYLDHADLSGARLSAADLRFAILNSSDLTNADLSNADLTNTDLSKADLTFAHFSGANLTYASLIGAVLVHAWVRDANLRSAFLVDADLSGASLSGADLGGADLRGADLSGADLTNADLSSADLTGADLTGAILKCTTGNDSTKMPPGVTRSDLTAFERSECKN